MHRVAFVMEQALGHVTHTQNLRAALAGHAEVEACWSLVEFRLRGWAARLPPYRNWTVRAGLRARRGLRELARRGRPDAVYFHTQVPAVFARRWLRRLPSVVSVDATPIQFDQLGSAYRHVPGPRWLEHLKWRLNRDCFRDATRVVAFSEWVKRGLVERYEVPADKVAVIPPGIDLARWRVRSRDSRPGPLRILFVGADFDRKGGPLLLAAFEAVRDLDVELHLVTRAAVAPAPGVFVHSGLTANSAELIELFRQADVFCLPTHADALGLVLCEAGAAGLPSIATDVGALSEVVRDGETGLVIPPGDLDALVAALRRLLTDESLRTRYGRAARAHVERHYDSASNAARVVELCTTVVAART